MDSSGWIAHWGAWTPDRTALRFEGRHVSYSQLEHDVGSAAAWLSDYGVCEGDRVAYLGPNCSELLVLLFACARLGAIFAPLNARMPPAELRVFVELTRPRVLVAERGLHRVARESVGEGGVDRVLSFTVGSELAGPAGGAERRAADSGIDAEAAALILFTSGTTGRPKGATFTHHNLAFNALNVITAFGLTAVDQILTAVPMFHAGGLLIHTTPGLCAGATITIHRQFDPGLVLEEVQRQRITLLACVPAMTFALTAHPAWEVTDLRSVRSVVTGSTVVPRRAIEPWQRKGVSVSQGYGSTEACPIATTTAPGSPPEAAFAAGRPVLHVQIRVVGRSGNDVAAGEPGEVWIRGPGVTQGYWENPRATRRAFSDGWFRTGDLGRIDQDGYLYVLDRITDIIIVGSSNVHPSDVESVLAECVEIREAAVVGRPEDELGEVPVAFVVRAQGRSLTPQQVIGLFQDRLASYKHPRDVIFLDALPRNATGKVDKRRLRELAAQAPGTLRGPTVPEAKPAAERS